MNGYYFLKWRNCGIVIDPGYDFICNFHDEGFHGLEVQAVLVSHNHPDHNADLKNLDDLRYEIYSRSSQVSDLRAATPFSLVWDLDSSQNLSFAVNDDRAAHRNPPIVFDRGRCGNGSDTIDLQEIADLPFQVKYFNVHHSADVPNAIGFIVELMAEDGSVAVRIGYTGDSRSRCVGQVRYLDLSLFPEPVS